MYLSLNELHNLNKDASIKRIMAFVSNALMECNKSNEQKEYYTDAQVSTMVSKINEVITSLNSYLFSSASITSLNITSTPPISVLSYYLGNNQTVASNTDTPIAFTVLDTSNSFGTVGGSYNTSTYTFTNTTSLTNTYFVTASIYTGSVYVQAVFKIVKNSADTFAVSAINTQAAGSTSAVLVLAPNDSIQVIYGHTSGSNQSLLSAGNLTRLTITQLDNVTS